MKVLFLCTGNSCRSQMAEGWARHLRADVIEAYSAGIEKHGMNPYAVQAMAEAGVDISKQHSKTLAELTGQEFDFVVTVCGHADEHCPMFPGKTKIVHVGFEDPPKLTKHLPDGEEKLTVYRRVRDEIRRFVETLPEVLKQTPTSRKSKTEVAVEKFLSGYNCAQSVLYAYAPELGLDQETALKLPTGLGAGMGRRGEVCGAVTGGILVLGLRYGRGAQQDRSATEVAYRKTEELMAGFEQRYGSCTCRVLLEGCDLRTAEGQQYVKEHDFLHTICAKCVETVAELLEGLMEDTANPQKKLEP